MENRIAMNILQFMVSAIIKQNLYTFRIALFGNNMECRLSLISLCRNVGPTFDQQP